MSMAFPMKFILHPFTADIDRPRKFLSHAPSHMEHMLLQIVTCLDWGRKVRTWVSSLPLSREQEVWAIIIFIRLLEKQQSFPLVLANEKLLPDFQGEGTPVITQHLLCCLHPRVIFI